MRGAGLEAERAALAEPFGLRKNHGRTDDGPARSKAKARLTRTVLERCCTLEELIDAGLLGHRDDRVLSRLHKRS